MTRLEVSRTLAAPPERVWRAFTEPAALAAWFWPERFGPTAEVDLRTGGRFRIAGPRVGMAVSGDYVEIEPPKRLVFTWQWDGEAEQTLVTVTLVAVADGTDLTVVHERFADDTSRDNHVQGWSDCLDRLPAWLAAPPRPAGGPSRVDHEVGDPTHRRTCN
jgi:uncharacterized protein YndB with AHSA1/START domain